MSSEDIEEVTNLAQQETFAIECMNYHLELCDKIFCSANQFHVQYNTWKWGNLIMRKPNRS